MPGIDETVTGAGGPLSRAEQLQTQLQQLGVALDQATEQGTWSDEALLKVDFRNLFAEWCVAQQDEVTRQLEALNKVVRPLILRFAWWYEVGGLTEEPQEVSSVQKQIFKGGVYQPRSWANAREALETTQKYRLPSSGDLAGWKNSIEAIVAEAERSRKCLAEYHAQLDMHDPYDPSWETYYDEKEPALRKSLGDYEYLWEISDFVPCS